MATVFTACEIQSLRLEDLGRGTYLFAEIRFNGSGLFVGWTEPPSWPQFLANIAQAITALEETDGMGGFAIVS
jgi:hypothetical protein